MNIYTVKEVSKILKCNINAVYELINSGELKALDGLGRLKIREEELLRFLEERQSKSNDG